MSLLYLEGADKASPSGVIPAVSTSLAAFGVITLDTYARNFLLSPRSVLWVK
jgi:hypothetical protein